MATESERARATRWVSATGWLGVALAAVGAVLLFAGWWGVSGEALIALQLPYLASASIPGAALLITGGILLSGESARRSAHDAERMIARLYDLLTEASLTEPGRSEPGRSEPGLAEAPSTRHAGELPVGAEARERPAGVDGVVAVPGGTRYHRDGCALVDGKPGVSPVDVDTIRARHLQPCPICTPSVGEG
jgi:hypothetical protein